VAAGVFLILLIIFIAQNLNDAPIHFLGLNGQVSIGLALLLAGVRADHRRGAGERADLATA